MTIDGDTGQVGPGLARRLDMPPLTSVNKVVEINQAEGYAIIHRKLEEGFEVIRSTLPCLFSGEKDINEVPYSTLPNMLRAARYQPHIWAVSDLNDIDKTQLGLKGSPTIVSSVWAPQKPQGGKLLEGTPDEQIRQLLDVVLARKELFEARAGGGAS